MPQNACNSALLSLVAVLCSAACSGAAVRSWPSTANRPGNARAAITRGLAFLDADAVKWRTEKKCASCHQGTMTVWALCEARSHGYPVDEARLAEVTGWTKERLAGIDRPRDSRPGWNMVNTPAVFLAVMARAIPAQTAITPAELDQIRGHLQRHQEADGSWAWSLAPAQNRPPPVFESDEIVTRLACIAIGPDSAGAAANDTYSSARDRAAAWLAKTTPEETTQAVAVRLLERAVDAKHPKFSRRDQDALRGLQNADGGWSQIRGIPSDAYATGQALYALCIAGAKRGDAAIKRGVAFLVASQREDGSWPMTSRAQPGAQPMTNPSPITYFGSAWATLGLLRSVAR